MRKYDPLLWFGGALAVAYLWGQQRKKCIRKRREACYWENVADPDMNLDECLKQAERKC